jgi:hypothetical protein
MSASLPRHPNLEHLKKSAKRLLAAQRQGNPQCCPLLRHLDRFADATDEQILAADVSLAEVQQLVAKHFGFPNWTKLKEEIEEQPDRSASSLDAVVERSSGEIPEYAGAGVPLGVVAALNHAGVDIDFTEFAAASGWAFSFGYQYDEVSAAHMGVRGDPKADGPFEVFAFLPLEYGFDYEMARTAEPDNLWVFVREHVDAGIPIMSEHMDGGLITAYRDKRGQRQLYFDGTVMPGWIDVDRLQPQAVYSLVRRHDATPPDAIRRHALERAVGKSRAAPWHGTPQGMAALEAYLADVADETKDFRDVEEWFCWAAFERLMARRCAEIWLRDTAETLDGEARNFVSEAADRYGEAFRQYEHYLSEVRGDDPTRMSLQERARTPERIAVIAGILERGIVAEEAGTAAIEQAVALLG